MWAVVDVDVYGGNIDLWYANSEASATAAMTEQPKLEQR
jgi:hypothetical protein